MMFMTGSDVQMCSLCAVWAFGSFSVLMGWGGVWCGCGIGIGRSARRIVYRRSKQRRENGL